MEGARATREKFLARLERKRDDGMDGWREGAENILRILDQRSALWLLLCLVNKALRQTSTMVEDLFRLPNVLEFDMSQMPIFLVG